MRFGTGQNGHAFVIGAAFAALQYAENGYMDNNTDKREALL